MIESPPVVALKDRARILHRAAEAGDAAALARLHTEGEAPLRRHALAAIAREIGFRGWKHAVDALSAGAEDAGKLLYPDSFGGALWNVWFASYDEAKATREETNGYLLPYGRQFFVCERYFVEQLGLDPDDPDWDLVGRDWARPRDRAAWNRLATKLVDVRLAATG